MKRTWWVVMLQGALLGLLLLLYFGSMFAFAQYSSSDFAKYYASVRYFWKGKAIYAPVAIDAFGPLPEGAKPTRETMHPNLSPPPLTLYLAPLGLWPYRTARVIWSTFSLLCGIVAVVLVGAATGRKISSVQRGALFVIVLLAYFPSFVNFYLGQVAFVLVLLLSIVWLAAQKGHDRAAGIALGLALSIKPFAGLLVLFFLVQRRWRLVFWCAATVLVAAACGVLAFGPSSYLDYLEGLGSVTWYASNWNASLLGFLTRLLGGSENIPLLNVPWLAHPLYYALSFAGILMMVWLSWPRTGEAAAEIQSLGFGLSLALMLLLSPLGWMYYFPVLFIALISAWGAAGTFGMADYKRAIVLAWLLSTVPTPLVASKMLNEPLICLTWAAVYFYALLAFSAILGSMLYRLRTKEAVQTLGG